MSNHNKDETISSTNASSPEKAKDIWDKLQTISSISGAIFVPIALLIGGYALDRSIKSQNDIMENKRISLQLTNAREKSDSDLKTSMFSKLLEKYESSDKQEDPKQKLFFLELLVYNFSETLTLTPIINDLLADFRKDPGSYIGLEDRLATALREAGARQIASLSITGAQSKFQLKKGGVKDLTLIYCKEDTSGSPSAIRFGIQVKLIELESDTSGVYQKHFQNGALVEVTTFMPDGTTGKKAATHRSFVIDQSDLPLIDNMPLSHGLRLAIMHDYRTETPTDSSSEEIPFLALGFSSQSTMMKDKPSDLDYVKYLNDSTSINPASKPVTNNAECNSLREGQSVGFVAPLPTDFEDIKINE
jgi:hypothetical protein